MAFNIKDEAVLADVRALAERTGESMTEAIARAVAERRLRLEQREAERRERTLRRIRRVRQRIIEGGGLSDADELLYDPRTGMPR